MRLIDVLDERKTQPKSQLSSHFTRMALLSTVIAIVVGLLLSPLFALQKVDIVGTKYINKTALEKKVSSVIGENLILLSKSKVREIVEEEPFLKEVSIAKRPLHTLVVTISEKTPVAILITNEVSYVVDNEARLLQVRKDTDAFDLPIISGLDLMHGEKLGEKVSDSRLALALKLIEDNKTAFSELIQEINVKNHRDILLYTTQGIEVRFGDDKNANKKLTKLFDIIEQVVLPRSLNGKIEYVDMRYLSGPVIKMNQGNKTLKADALPIAQAP